MEKPFALLATAMATVPAPQSVRPRMWLVLAALLLPWTLVAAEPVWPEPILELERIALRDPYPGTAWMQLRNFALENGLMASWSRRWEARIAQHSGAEECLLLGWMDVESGNLVAARGRFAQAVAVAPESYHAWLAVAELQLRGGDAAGSESARRAVALARTDAERVMARRLPALVAQERGELSKAWSAWQSIEADSLPIGVRIALMPDLARAHLALGDAQAWAAKLTELSSRSADDAAVAATAVLALGDAAFAHRLATEALKAHPDHAALQRVAIDASEAAGFLGEAADRIESSLGDAPGDDALLEALRAFVKMGAPDHATRLFRRHAVRLAPIATRWREWLPDLWRFGVTPELRKIFAAQAAIAGWELPLARAEMAMLEKDFAEAEELLWRVLAKDFDRDDLASLARAGGNSPRISQEMLPLRGYGVSGRLVQIRQFMERESRVLDPKRPGNGWSVFSLCDGRDVVLAYLHRLAMRSGDDAGFLTRFRERTAHWPAEERLLAYAIAGHAGALIDAATEIVDAESSSESARSVARAELQRLRLVPRLPPESSERLGKLLERLPQPAVAKAGPSLGHRWLETLKECWKLFDAGKFAAADQAFREALDTIGARPLGPSPQNWAAFHASTLYGAWGFSDKNAGAQAASFALRWVALQTPRRTDWPAPARPQTIWLDEPEPGSIRPLFWPNRQRTHNFYGKGSMRFFEPIGGSLPENLWPALMYFTISRSQAENESDKVKVPVQATALLPESRPLLTMVNALTSLFYGEAPETAALEGLFDSPDGAAARLLLQQGAHSDSDSGGVVRHDYLSPVAATVSVGRAEWLLARLHLLSPAAPLGELAPKAEELLRLPLDAHTRKAAREELERMARDREPQEKTAVLTLAGRFVRPPWRTGAEPLPSEVEERLRVHLAAVEIDQAVALAKRVLDWPAERFAGDEKLVSVQKEALTALHECGELNAWFAERWKRAKSGGSEDWARLAAQCDWIIEAIPASDAAPAPSRKPGRGLRLDRFADEVRRDAHTARLEARLALVRLHPEEADHWSQLLAPREEKDPAAAVDTELLLRGAGADLDVDQVKGWLGDDLDKLEDLAERWKARPVRPPDESDWPRAKGLDLARQLWAGGRKEAATRWLEKVFAAHGAAITNATELRVQLLEALAVRGDRPGMVRVLTRALRESISTPPGITLYPKKDFYGGINFRWPAVGPILNQVAALGMGDEVMERLAAEPDPVATQARLLLRLHRHEREALAELAAWLDRHPSMQILEELSLVLASWPEARGEAQRILRMLEPAYALPEMSERVEQLGRHASQAARCGMAAEADRWWRAARAAEDQMPSTGRFHLFSALEALTFPSVQNEAGEVANAIAVAAKSGRYSESTYIERLGRLEDAGCVEAVRILTKAFEAHSSFKDRASAQALSVDTHTLGAREGRWDDFTPLAWLKRVNQDGTIELGWTLGWYFGEGDNRTFVTPDFSAIPKGKPMRVELFFGREMDQFERVAVIDEAGPAGVWQGSGRLSDGFLTGTISVEGRTIFGAVSPIRLQKNLLPPLAVQIEKLPRVLWSQTTLGPAGETLRGLDLYRGISLPSEPPQSLAGAYLELPLITEERDVFLSGWIKGGRIELVFVDAIGVAHSVQSLMQGDARAWMRIDLKIPNNVSGQMNGKKTPHHLLMLAPGGEYSGLTVVEVKPSTLGEEQK